MQKLQDIVVHIGYPTEFNSPTKKEYSIKMGPTFLGNFLKIKQNVMFETCRRFHNPNVLSQEKWAFAFNVSGLQNQVLYDRITLDHSIYLF